MVYVRRLLSVLLAIAVVAGVPAWAAAPFEDSMAQRMVACTVCHGAQGRAAPDGYYPRIAGKPAGYLYNQLQHFRDGRRSYRLMAHLLEPLSDDYLHEMAQYFSARDLPYAAPTPLRITAQSLQRGRQLALQGDAQRQLPACSQCHGAALTGVLPATPGLLGLPRDYLNAQLGAWRSGSRKAHGPDCMATVAQRLSPSDVSDVSGWLALQPVPAQARPVVSTAMVLPMACGSAFVPVRKP
jgi:cytochrome c553